MRSAPSSEADRLLPGPVTAVPLLLAVGALVVFPLFDLVRTAFSTTGAGAGLDGEAIRNSLVTATVAAVLAARTLGEIERVFGL